MFIDPACPRRSHVGDTTTAERSAPTDALGGQLFDRYGQSLFTYCLLMLDSADLAGVVVHDSILVAVSHAADLTRVPDVRTWLFAVARNEVRRARLSLPPDASADPSGFRPRDDHPSAPVWQAMQRIGWEQRELLLLTAQQGLSYRQLANVLGVPARAARRDTNRAHHQLELTLGAVLGVRPGTAQRGALRRQITAALATTPTPAVPTELSRTIRSSCRVPPRVLYFGGRAGRFEANGFPRPWDRRRFGGLPVGRGVLAGCALVLPLVAVAADATDQPTASPVQAAPDRHPSVSAPLPTGPAATSPTAKPTPSRSHPAASHKPSATPSSAGASSAAAPPAAGTSVSATFAANSTLTCNPEWSGTATATVSGGRATAATLLWTADGTSHTVAMTATDTTHWQATVNGLPRGTVRWSVQVTTSAGPASSTEQTATQSCVL
jgi:DNA-directed RNA polymerase specialized sigma24 family protein